MDWHELPQYVDAWVEKTADAAAIAQLFASQCYTDQPTWIYWHPERQAAGIHYSAEKAAQDLILPGLTRCLTGAQIIAEDSPLDCGWVKVAVSPTIRAIGEATNFLPGVYPGGIPNDASPLAGTITSGLIGAGLGYGAGTLGETLLPDRWERGRLRKTLALAGALPGVALGGALMAGNVATGRSFNDTEIIGKVADDTAYAEYLTRCDRYIARISEGRRALFKEAFGDTPPLNAPGITIDSLGRVLWGASVSPPVQAMAFEATRAASRMPGGIPGSHEVTPAQFGNLATNIGTGYLTGAVVGSVLGLLTGMPEEDQAQLRQTGMIAGIVHAVLPKLYGFEEQ